MRIDVAECNEAAGQHAAGLIADGLRVSIARRGRACLALSGGRTPWPMIAALARQRLPWRRVHLFQTDERMVPPDSPRRTFAHLQDTLIDRVKLQAEHVHAMPVDEDDLAAAALRYETVLARAAGTPPVLDLVHLGLGADGHTASLVPADPVLDVAVADVAVTGPYQGDRRITLTYPALNRAAAIVWLVTGSAKAEALRRLVAGDTSIPAGRVRRDGAIIVTDRAAASLLDQYEGIA